MSEKTVQEFSALDSNGQHFVARQLIDAARQDADAPFKWLLLLLPTLLVGLLHVGNALSALPLLKSKEQVLQGVHQRLQTSTKDSKARLEDQSKHLRQKISDLQDQTTVSIPLSGKQSLDIPLVLVPSLLSGLVVVMLLYFRAHRISIVNQFLRALTIASTGLKLPALQLAQLVEMIPIWCFPVPRKSLHGANEAISVALSGKKFAGVAKAATLLCALILIAYQVALGYCGVIISHETGHPGIQLLNVLPWVGMWLAVIIFADWMQLNIAAGAGYRLKRGDWTVSLDRRHLVFGSIASALVLAAGGVSWASFRYIVAQKSHKRPRFSRPSSLPRGNYEDTSTRIVHHSRGKLPRKCLSRLPSIRLRHIPDDQVLSLKPETVHLRCGSSIVEKLVLSHLSAGEIDRACGLLMWALRLNPGPLPREVNLRWLDLSAGLAVRFNRLDLMKEVAELTREAVAVLAPVGTVNTGVVRSVVPSQAINGSLPSNALNATANEALRTREAKVRRRQIARGKPKLLRAARLHNALENRLKRWNDPNGEWYKKWSDHNRKVKWTGLLM